VGIEQKTSSSFKGWRGRPLDGPQTTALRNREVYLTVNPVAKKKRIIIIVFWALPRVNSRIASLE